MSNQTEESSRLMSENCRLNKSIRETREGMSYLDKMTKERDHYRREMERLADECRACHAKCDEYEDFLRRALVHLKEGSRLHKDISAAFDRKYTITKGIADGHKQTDPTRPG